jgi:hypothetical protein
MATLTNNDYQKPYYAQEEDTVQYDDNNDPSLSSIEEQYNNDSYNFYPDADF